MKFLGIYPPDIQWKGEPRRGGTPLGLLSVLGELRNQGHDVSFLDAKMEGYDQFSDFAPNRDVFVYGMTKEQIKQRVREEKPDVVGVSIIHNTAWYTAKTVFEAVKRANPEILTVAGGHLANGAVNHILNDCEDLDVVVMNEGEATAIELLESLKIGRSFRDSV